MGWNPTAAWADYVDAEAAALVILRPALAPAPVTLDLPTGWAPGPARLTLHRTGGTATEASADVASLQLDSWAGVASTAGQRQLASDLIRDALRALRDARGVELADPACLVVSSTIVLGPVWSPDPDTNAARYTASANVKLRPL